MLLKDERVAKKFLLYVEGERRNVYIDKHMLSQFRTWFGDKHDELLKHLCNCKQFLRLCLEQQLTNFFAEYLEKHRYFMKRLHLELWGFETFSFYFWLFECATLLEIIIIGL